MKIEQGICKDTHINDVKFSAIIITPSGAANARTLQPITGPHYIVVHNTGDTAQTADADALAKYLQVVENADQLYVSWHITVDCDHVVQHLPFTEKGYHAGDGSNGTGNSEGLAIEIAENKEYAKSEENAISIICALRKQYDIPLDKVQPHRYFDPDKKLCPHMILKSEETWQDEWKAFQEKIQKKYDELYSSSAAETPTDKSNNTNASQVSIGIRTTVENAEKDGAITDKNYWMAVLNGEKRPKPEWLKLVMDRYHIKLMKKK